MTTTRLLTLLIRGEDVSAVLTIKDNKRGKSLLNRAKIKLRFRNRC